MRGAIRLLNTLLLASVTTKPAVALAGFGAGLGWRGSGPQSDGLSVPLARLLVNGRSGQQLVMRRRTIRLSGLAAICAIAQPDFGDRIGPRDPHCHETQRRSRTMPVWFVFSRDPLLDGRVVRSRALPSEKAALSAVRDLRRQYHEVIRIEGPEGVIEKEAIEIWLAANPR